MAQTVLVTGASGFIGARVVAALAEAGYRVRAGTRRDSAEWGAGIAAVACDLDRPDQVREAVADVAAVIHCAYGDPAAMSGQCQTLLAAMSGAGVRRLVYFSSIAVYGTQERPDPTRPPEASALRGAYARAKAACESLVRDWAGSDARAALILRPGIVYGAGSPLWIDKIVQRIDAGVWGDFGARAAAPAPLIHVEDVARATLAALRRLDVDGAGLDAVDLVGPDTPSWNVYFQRVAAASGAGLLPRVTEARLAQWLLGGTVIKLARRLGFKGGARLALAPTPGELRLFSSPVVLDRQRSAAILGFSPGIGLEEGLARSFQADRLAS